MRSGRIHSLAGLNRALRRLDWRGKGRKAAVGNGGRSVSEAFERFARNRRGNAIIIIAASLPMVIGFCGLGLDVVTWYQQEDRVQQAADIAAYGGARAALLHGGEFAGVRDAVNYDASVYGLTPEPPVIDRVARTVSVRISTRADLYFSAYFLEDGFTMWADATASWSAPCVLALDPSMPSAIYTGSGSTIEGIDCSVQANSSSLSAIYSDSNSNVIGERVCVGGGAQIREQGRAVILCDLAPVDAEDLEELQHDGDGDAALVLLQQVHIGGADPQRPCHLRLGLAVIDPKPP